MSEESGWRVTDSEYVIDSPFLRLRKDTIVLPDGRRIDDFYVRETRGFAIIFAITKDRNVVFVREYKHGIGESLLGLPGGMIEENEQPAVCASRELAEETGYEGRAEFVRTFITDPVNSNSRFHLFVVRDAAPTGTQSFDPTEDIAVELLPLAEVRALARGGTINVGNYVASIYAALEYLGAL